MFAIFIKNNIIENSSTSLKENYFITWHILLLAKWILELTPHYTQNSIEIKTKDIIKKLRKRVKLNRIFLFLKIYNFEAFKKIQLINIC